MVTSMLIDFVVSMYRYHCHTCKMVDGVGCDDSGEIF